MTIYFLSNLWLFLFKLLFSHKGIQQIEIITEMQTLPKCNEKLIIIVPNPNDASTPNAQWTLRKTGSNNYKNQKLWTFTVWKWQSSIYDREIVPMNSQQYGPLIYHSLMMDITFVEVGLTNVSNKAGSNVCWVWPTPCDYFALLYSPSSNFF